MDKTITALFEHVIDPAVQLVFALAVFYFVYGVFTYIKKSGDSSERINGANHVMWGTIGLFIMVSVWGIIAILKSLVLGS